MDSTRTGPFLWQGTPYLRKHQSCGRCGSPVQSRCKVVNLDIFTCAVGISCMHPKKQKKDNFPCLRSGHSAVCCRILQNFNTLSYFPRFTVRP